MFTERISLTMAPGGENHRGNQLIGRMPVKGEGFKHSDISLMAEQMQQNGYEIELLNLNEMSGNATIKELCAEDQGRLLIVRNWMNKATTTKIYDECTADQWDSKYLDPNKYRSEIVNGEEKRIRGRVMNKIARTNLCYVAGIEQEPEYLEGKGRIVDLNTKSTLSREVDLLRNELNDALKQGNSDSKVEINVVEGNRYYDLKKTGIGFHGDTERVVVICLTIGGGDNYPMRFNWFKGNMPVGNSIDIRLNDGDLYIMSEKAVGADWKLSGKYTLRHSAGCDKYTSLKKWHDRAAKLGGVKPAIKEKKATSEEKAKAKALAKEEKMKAKALAKEEKMKAKALAKEEKMKAKALAKEEKMKAKQNAHMKAHMKKIAKDVRAYRKALKNCSWEPTDKGFQEWGRIQAGYECAPRHDEFWECYKVDSDCQITVSHNCPSTQGVSDRAFYNMLCEYKHVLFL